MSDRPTLAFALMDAPYESTRTTTALRLLAIAADRGCHIKVFAYEGAVMLPFARQLPHADPMHSSRTTDESPLLPRKVIAALMQRAEQRGGSLDWVNCGPCIDERGADEAIPGVRRGSPDDFWQMTREADNTLVIPTRD